MRTGVAAEPSCPRVQRLETTHRRHAWHHQKLKDSTHGRDSPAFSGTKDGGTNSSSPPPPPALVSGSPMHWKHTTGVIRLPTPNSQGMESERAKSRSRVVLPHPSGVQCRRRQLPCTGPCRTCRLSSGTTVCRSRPICKYCAPTQSTCVRIQCRIAPHGHPPQYPLLLPVPPVSYIVRARPREIWQESLVLAITLPLKVNGNLH